jgi:hypothetical protein
MQAFAQISILAGDEEAGVANERRAEHGMPRPWVPRRPPVVLSQGAGGCVTAKVRDSEGEALVNVVVRKVARGWRIRIEVRSLEAITSGGS